MKIDMKKLSKHMKQRGPVKLEGICDEQCKRRSVELEELRNRLSVDYGADFNQTAEPTTDQLLSRLHAELGGVVVVGPDVAGSNDQWRVAAGRGPSLGCGYGATFPQAVRNLCEKAGLKPASPLHGAGLTPGTTKAA